MTDFNTTMEFETVDDEMHIKLTFDVPISLMDEFCDKILQPGVEAMLYNGLVDTLRANGVDVSNL